MPRGVFITLEGLDGSGKTTQIKRLAAWLTRRGQEPVVLRQPGGTATGDRIREILLDSRSAAVAPMTEMALMFADRAQAIAEVIQPALDAGKHRRLRPLHRFHRGLPGRRPRARLAGRSRPASAHLRRTAARPHAPAAARLCGFARPRAPPQRPRRGRNRHADESRFESEQDAFYRRVWEKYREIAAREPERVVLIEGDLTIDEVHEQIVESVSERIVAIK